MKSNFIKLDPQLSAISRCVDKDLIAVGGMTLLKICSLSVDNEFKLVKVLKVSKYSNKTGTKDVSWNPKENNLIASTTLQNSQILLWDIEKSQGTSSCFKLGFHEQLINRISWNPIKPNLLASCSLDQFLKIWDNHNAICNKDSKDAINPNPVISIETKERIRDCQFSPIEENHLLTSYVNGNISLWDLRMYKTPVKRFLQHTSDVLTIDWHPLEKNVFCSGGMDKNLYIWDINKDPPILSYKTSQGTSRVKWYQYNPQYIVTSYQMNNLYTSFWNINIPNIPEYKYPGHKDVVIGFCWDLSRTRLITCSKEGTILVQDLDKGLRSFDHLSTSVIKFSQCDELLNYHEEKPPRKSFEECDISKLVALTTPLPTHHSNLRVNEPKKSIIETMNFNQSDFSIKNNPSQSHRMINLNKEFALNYTIKLQQYYKLNKKQIEQVFNNYFFILEGTRRDSELKISLDLTYSEKLLRAILYNLDMTTYNIRNYNHYAIWNELKFLAQQESFKCLDEYPSREQSSNSSLYVHIIKSNVLQIVDYLIDVHSDIYLATIISYLFHPILEKEGKIKNRLLRMQMDCWDYVRRLKLFVIANKLKKFGLSELRKNQEDPILIMSCKSCNCWYDGTKQSECSSCGKRVNCFNCFEPINGLFLWCSGCGHGGHVDHIDKWFRETQVCPILGCDHVCVSSLNYSHQNYN